MTAFTFFLCIVLSGLLSFSRATILKCPLNDCIVINEKPCCGENANGPKSAPQSVSEEGGSARVMAGFPKNNQDPYSRPTCSQIFQWSTDALTLEFTAGFALEGLDQGDHMRVVLQDFKRVDGSATQPDQGCPIENNLPPAKNPYSIPKSTTSSLDGADEAANDPLASLATAFAFNQIGPVLPPGSDLGGPIEPSPAPAELSSIFGANPIAVAFDGGDCMYGACSVAPFAPLDIPINMKRGTPDAPVLPPRSDLGGPIEPSPSPAELPSISPTNPFAVAFEGGDCSYGGCAVTPLDNPTNMKRGTPVEFRA